MHSKVLTCSLFSWGMPPSHPAVVASGDKPSGQDDLAVQDDLIVQDVTEETERQQPSTEAAVEEMVTQTRLDVSSFCSLSERGGVSSCFLSPSLSLILCPLPSFLSLCAPPSPCLPCVHPSLPFFCCAPPSSHPSLLSYAPLSSLPLPFLPM